MVQVPVTPGRSVQVQPLDAKPLRYARSRDFMGPAISQAGQALGQAAKDWDEIEAAYDEAAALDADNTTAANASLIRTEFLNLRGQEPANALPDQLKTFESDGRDRIAALRSERAKAMANRAFAVRLSQLRETMQGHADKQMFAFRDGALEAGIKQGEQDAIDAYGSDQFPVALGSAITRLTERSALNGWSPEELSAATSELTGRVYGQAILGLDAAGNPSAAMEAIDRHKEDIGPEIEERLRSAIAPRARARWAEGLAPSLVEALATKEGEEVAPARDLIFADPLGGKGVTVKGGVWGASRSYGGHSGQDYAAAAGTPVNPTAGGKVIFAGQKGGYGNRVEIDHGGGWISTYSHLASINVAAGDTVDTAALVGAVGNTGSSRGAHLHYEMMKDGKKVKPFSGSAGQAVRSPGADARLDPRAAEAAARSYAKENNLSEDDEDALVDAARRQSSQLREERNFREQEAERRLDQWIADNDFDLADYTSEGQIPAAIRSSLAPSTLAQLEQKKQDNRRRIAEEQEQQRQAAELQASIMSGGVLDFGDKDVRNATDALYRQQIGARGPMDAAQAQAFNVAFATRVGFIPPSLRSSLRAQLRNSDPSLQIYAASTIAEISARNPAMLNDFADSEITRAESLNYYRRRGFNPAQAADRVNEIEQLTKADRNDRGTQFAEQAKTVGKVDDLLEEAFDQKPSAVLTGEFNGLWKQEFIRTGDINLARSTALAALKKQWGVSRVNGSAQIMRYPPELHYGQIDRGGQDAQWIREQGFRELVGNGLVEPNAKERFSLRPWNRTVAGRPAYIGTLQQPDGTIVTLSDDRGRPKLFVPDFSETSIYRDGQRRRREGVDDARRQRASSRTAPRALPTSQIPRGPKI